MNLLKSFREKEGELKALTLYQPWATLVAIGAKRIETRSWATRYRGPLGIHASLNKRFAGMRSKNYICGNLPFNGVLTKGIQGISALTFMPFGAIIAICNLDHCQKIKPLGLPSDLPPEPERSFGDYTPGRYMWFLQDIRKLDQPIFVKGSMGLWDWDEGP
jgi:hypothetical protein